MACQKPVQLLKTFLVGSDTIMSSKKNQTFAKHITRRDFVNGAAVGIGSAFAPGIQPVHGKSNEGAAPHLLGKDWYGYGGVGPYRESHGNTPELVNTAHTLRNGQSIPAFELEAVEAYDLVIVGGGLAGLGAALEFNDQHGPERTCLLLDNHPVIGGEAKENEFAVEGERLIAPQGANGFFIPPANGDTGDAYYYAKLGLPRDFTFREWPTQQSPLRFCRDNYGYLVAGLQKHTSTGHFFRTPGHQEGTWVTDLFDPGTAHAPLSEITQKRLHQWFAAGQLKDFGSAEEARRELDTMSYEDFLNQYLNASDEGARYADLFLASACGLGSDAVSAYAAFQLPMPGLFDSSLLDARRVSFPGGNSGFVRYFLKHLIPDSIQGGDSFEEVITNPLNPGALDKPGQPVRMRTNSTVLSVSHDGHPADSKGVNLVYVRGGKHYGLRAKSVVMATGSWMTKKIVVDLPETHVKACDEFLHAPFLVANVALTNWRFLHKLGITAAIWDRDDQGFGFTCNIRNPMQVGDYQPPLDPNKPTVLSFYTPFHRPGVDPKAQVSMGRAALFNTSYTEYESQILRQMLQLFGPAGFNPKRDVAGLILNRWGHAYSVPYPGFYGGASGSGPADTLRQNVGRISFAHSELAGLQHYGPAADEGRRAAQQASQWL